MTSDMVLVLVLVSMGEGPLLADCSKNFEMRWLRWRNSTLVFTHIALPNEPSYSEQGVLI